jgi:hypothetical protein
MVGHRFFIHPLACLFWLSPASNHIHPSSLAKEGSTTPAPHPEERE